MFFSKNKSKNNYKLDGLKVFSMNQSVGSIKKYRNVYEKTEITYLSSEISFFNKLFDEKDWETEITIIAWDLSEEHAIKICEEKKSVTISKDINNFKHIYGWGNYTKGEYWEKGIYSWEAQIDNVIVASTKFYIEDAGSVSEINNPYITAVSLSTYEAPAEDVEMAKRVYLKSFNINETRYIMGEFCFTNLLPNKWYCEFFFNIYDDTGLLVGSSSTLTKISPDVGPNEEFTIGGGWGSDSPEIWVENNYKMEVVFMDTVLAVIPFKVGDKDVVRISEYEALLNEDVGINFNDILKVEEENNEADDVLETKESEVENKKEETTENQKNEETKKEDEIEILIDNRPLKEILGELDALIGLKNIKLKIREYIDYVSFLQYREQSGIKEEEEISLHSVFTGNPGTGKTTVVKLLGGIFHSMGVLSKGHVHSVNANDLISGYIRQTGKDTKEAIKKARGGILFIDEAYTLFKKGASSDFGPEAITELLTEMSDGPGDISIMMAGYPKEMEELLNSNPGIKSRIRNYYHFEDYTPDELYSIAEFAANKKSVKISKRAAKQIKHILTEGFRKRDKTFGNARFAHALIDEAKINLGVRVMKDPKLETLSNDEISTLKDIDIEDISKSSNDKKLTLIIEEDLLKEALAEINELTGLATIKQEVNELVKLSRYYKENNRDILKAFSMHSVFLGNPGTGKTTVARIIAKIYKALGMLERGHLIDADGSDLEAGYLGQTAIKTKDLISKSMGGILFIDEAYAITEGKNSDFGRKAIAALIKEMEDHRSEFGLIAAGYTQNMADFLESNPGLKSRFDNHFVFEDFNEDELWEIATNMYQNKGVVTDKKASEHLKNYISYLYSNRDKFFGNARSMRKIVEKSTRNHELRMADLSKTKRTKKMMATISIEDVKEFVPDKDKVLRRRSLGFHHSTSL